MKWSMAAQKPRYSEEMESGVFCSSGTQGNSTFIERPLIFVVLWMSRMPPASLWAIRAFSRHYLENANDRRYKDAFDTLRSRVMISKGKGDPNDD